MEYYKILDIDSLPNEEWKDVIGYEGLYEVSSLGRVKSLIDNHGKPREKILCQTKNKGYLYVSLWKEGKGKTCKVHRLVANAFIPNPSNLPQVNHIDENKENNAVDNLEWCNATYNNNYGTRLDIISEKQLNDPNKSKKVYQYSLDGELVKIWKSTRECGRQGYNFGAVAACCLGKRKTHKGYIWSYVPLDTI